MKLESGDKKKVTTVGAAIFEGSFLGGGAFGYGLSTTMVCIIAVALGASLPLVMALAVLHTFLTLPIFTLIVSDFEDLIAGVGVPSNPFFGAILGLVTTLIGSAITIGFVLLLIGGIRQVKERERGTRWFIDKTMGILIH